MQSTCAVPEPQLSGDDALSRSARRYRIDPANLVEAGEVTVRADHGEAVLDADRCQYRVGDQPGSEIVLEQQGS